MTARVYEGMFILDSNRYARDPSGVTGQLDDMVQRHGGEVLASRLWAEQKLAYPIQGHRKGTYWLSYFRIDSSKQKELIRECRLNENILRNLILAVDQRLVDTLVEHARAGGQRSAGLAGPEGSERLEGSDQRTADKGSEEESESASDTR